MKEPKIKNFKNSSILIEQSEHASRADLLESEYLNKKAEPLLRVLEKKQKKTTPKQIYDLLSTYNFDLNTLFLSDFVHKLVEIPVNSEQQILLVASSYEIKIGHEIVSKILSLF